MNVNSTKLLHDYLKNSFPQWQRIKIRNIENLTAGWESDIYAVNLSYRQGDIEEQRELILRIYPGDGAGEKSRHEFLGMQLLHQLGYPVPEVFTLEDQPSPIGKAFMVMEHITGDMMWHMIDKSSPERQAELLAQFCRLFVQLHNLDWRPFVESQSQIDHVLPYIFIDRWIEEAKRAVVDFEREEFLPVVEWLSQNRDEMGAEKPSIIHHDFHPGNILVTPQYSAVVIDWTGWQVTDYRFDLAWTLLLTRAYAGEELGNAILVGYEKACGEIVKNLEFFEVCACARRLFDVTTSLSLGAERLGMRPETVETMRTQIGHLAIVYDLLREYTHLRIPQVEQLLQGHNQHI